MTVPTVSEISFRATSAAAFKSNSLNAKWELPLFLKGLQICSNFSNSPQL